MKIHQLSPQVVAKIAAGEVIERPVYAVKELIENAIDAGADVISVHMEESGLKRITVIDNGEGMSKEDLQESFKPHTTSKLTKADELSAIHSLGFRGEALASIAAISRLTINSRESSAKTGMSVFIKNGKLEKMTPIGMPIGTSVTVEQLFHALPARKKFLGSARTEFRHVLDLLIRYILSYPHIYFVLTHNKKTLLDFPATDDHITRIEKLLGKDIFASLVPVSFENTYISVNGYVAKPSVTTRTPNKQFLFINNRSVSDKAISLTVKSAFGTLLASSVYPIYILHISLPHEMVDVNVHPRKEYVRFVDTFLLYDVLKHAVSEALVRYDLTPTTGFEPLFLSDAIGSTESYAGRLLKEKKQPWKLSKSSIDISSFLQINNLYLLFGSQDGLVLIDQHAAHERILYEQLLTEFIHEKKQNTIFRFPKPGIFELSLSESELLKGYLYYFQKLGWEIEHFKDATFIVRSLPVLFKDRDYVRLLKEILEDLQKDSHPAELDAVTRQMIAYLACRGAVKAGEILSKKQTKELILQLGKTPNNATCPHGRPTKIVIDMERINRLFKR